MVVLLDGGICSQMHQYLLGQCFVDKGESVYYDLSFFEDWGSDLNQCFVRNFDLLKAFLHFCLTEAFKIIVHIYKRKFYFRGNKTGGNLK